MFIVRLVLGVIKGAVIGAAVGLGVYKLGMGGSWLSYVTYGLIGFLAGMLCGTPFWSHARSQQGTIFTALLKGIFGIGLAIGLFVLARHVLTMYVTAPFGSELGIAPTVKHHVYNWPFLLGPAVGALYGAFVEIDDGGEGKKAAAPAKKK